MAFHIKDKALQATLERHVRKAQQQSNNSLEKLSSGSNFSRSDPKPAERALAEGLEFKLRSLSSSKNNINSAVNLLQTAESSLSEVSNMILRMKEINIAASNTTVSDKERKFLFIEYEALFDEVNRVAVSTSFNGIPLLNGDDPAGPEELVFRVGDPFDPSASGESVDVEGGDDINAIRFSGLKNIVVTTAGLGLRSAKDLLIGGSDEGGLSLVDVEDLMMDDGDEDGEYATVYDRALNTISTQRSVLGGLQSRLNRATDFLDVYTENIAAAKSSIADVDYASEVSKLVESRMLLQAGTAMLSQGNINSQLALGLLKDL